MKDTFIATIINAQPNFGSDFNQSRYEEWLKQNEGKKIKISKPKEKRTLSQNNYYWLFLGVIERETGNDANDLHELFRRTKLKPKVIKVYGKEITIPRSTTDLSKTEFGEYLDKISAETGIALPDRELAGFYVE